MEDDFPLPSEAISAILIRNTSHCRYVMTRNECLGICIHLRILQFQGLEVRYGRFVSSMAEGEVLLSRTDDRDMHFCSVPAACTLLEDANQKRCLLKCLVTVHLTICGECISERCTRRSEDTNAGGKFSRPSHWRAIQIQTPSVELISGHGG